MGTPSNLVKATLVPPTSLPRCHGGVTLGYDNSHVEACSSPKLTYAS